MDDPARKLVQEASKGGRAAVDALLEQYLPALHAFVRVRAGKQLRAREQTEDLVQSVCREALDGLEGFEYRGEAAFKHWLFEAALHKILDRARYHKSQKRDVGREVVPAAASASATSHEDILDCYRSFCTPSRVAIAREELERVDAAIGGLSERDRRIIVLSRIVGLSHAEIAKELGCTEHYARTVLFRALSRLSTRLKEGGKDDTKGGGNERG